jgi:FMN phosphatase YigB (HAD superfamily)
MGHEPVSGISFDLFGTLVTVDRPDDPAEAVAHALEERHVPIPDDWSETFGERHIDAPDGAEIPLTDHVVAALASRANALDRASGRDAVEHAVRAAFDTDVRTRDGAATAVETLGERLPVGVLSNCSVPGLAEQAIGRSDIDSATLDVITTSVDCGWRKPDPRAFRAVADGLGINVRGLLHVGDDPVADGGAVESGATALLTDETPISDVPEVVEGWG